MMNFIKQSLFRILGLNSYLGLLQKSYLFAYRAGLLKNNKSYAWHHFVKKLIKPGDTVIDIGANLGYFSAIFIQLVSDAGHVYAVEPVEPYRRQLQKIIANHKNATILPFALGEENKEAITLGMPDAFKNLGYLKHGVVTIETNERAVAKDYTFSSPLKKASEVFSGLNKIDYIKCDIEGYETVVLKEMKELLQKHQPLVQLETWGEQLPIMLSFFESIGFEAYHLEKDRLTNCKNLSLDIITSADVLFVASFRKESIQPFIKHS